MKYSELKQELKELAASIREAKSKRKSSSNGYVHGLCYDRNTYRHKHIAYCLLRGRSIEQIEQSNRPDNKPCQYLIERYMEQYKIEDEVEVENE